MKERFVVVDLETTGHSVAQGDRIIQVGAVVLEDGEIIERFTTFVNPEKAIPPFIENLTGISDHMVINAPTFSTVIPELLGMLENSYFVAHNVQFDLTFLQNQLDECGYNLNKLPVIDTVELSRLLLPDVESYKLSQLADFLDFDHDRPHQADSDAEVTAHLLLTLLERIDLLPVHTMKQLLELGKHLKSDIHVLLQDRIKKKESDIAFRVGSGIDLYRDLAIKQVHHEGEEANVRPLELTFDEFKEHLHHLENVHEKIQHYEVRSGQLEMMDQVHSSFQDNQHLLIEAGTGTGKSLGYLIPSIFYAKENENAVVISTHTIPLQQQLIDRDIPLLKNLLPFPFKAAILKGRRHYLCLRKFENRMQDHFDDNYETILAKGQILIWLTKTETGDLEELNLPSYSNPFWFEVQSESATCLNHQCPWFARCFYHRAKRRARTADIIITNHALLFTDQMEDQNIIPTYTHAVIDEAHHLEEVASNYLGLQLDYVSFSSLLTRLLNHLRHSERLDKVIDEHLTKVKLEIDELFRMLRSYVLSKKSSQTSEIGRVSYRYESHLEKGIWKEILECGLRATSFIGDLHTLLSKLMDHEQIENEHTLQRKSEISSLKSLLKTITKAKEELDQLLLQYDPNYVYWIEVEEKGAKNATYLYSRPIELSEQLADQFFMKKKSVVLTSATLTIRDKFNFLIKRYGLEDFGPKTSMIPSPFQYEDQAKLLIPTDVVNIKDSEVEFIDDISNKIISIAEKTKGRMLILFTSFDMLKRTYELTKERTVDESFVFIAQGIYSGSRNKLIKTFKQHDKAILFGTSTFWEGIDIPGEDLSCLVIVRLPFAPPNDPLLQARSERLKDEGGNPFMELALPQAILRFKQGFGRLIRSSRDRGVVVVLDNRLIKTRYGSQFIKSLPPVPVFKGTMEKLEKHLEELN